MADSGVELVTAEALPVEQFERTEAPVGEPADAAAASSIPDEIPPAGGDHKRKLGDLEPHEEDEAPLKKQEVVARAPALGDDDEVAAGGGEDVPSQPERQCDESGKHESEETPDVAIDDHRSADVERAEEKGDETAAQDSMIAAVNAETDEEKLSLDGRVNGSGKHDSEETPDVAIDDHRSADVERTKQKGDETAAQDSMIATLNAKTDEEKLSLDGTVNDSVVGGQEVQELKAAQMGDGELPLVENIRDASAPPTETGEISRRIEVPNSKVGVLIGKAGDTVKYLQYNSGAKIQITRDADTDPHSSTRIVELMGNLEQISKAEKLIKDVVAEADAGGSPSLVARGFGTVQSGGDQIEMRVPNEKVGLIIGKGGETIKNLQTRSGARIQLIPQHLPESDSAKERTVRITGNKKQIESAKEMIKDVMNQIPVKLSPLSGGYSQQGGRPRGPAMLPQGGGRSSVPTQPNTGYDYQPRGTYAPPQASQYPQPYGGYLQHLPPREGSFGTSWEQRAVAPAHNAPATGGYDYYGQGGQVSDTHIVPNPSPASFPASHGHSQGPGYGHGTPYVHSTPTQQNYGHGYNEHKYDGQGPHQQFYGQQPVGVQSGAYGQASAQLAYGQPQSYNKPAYGATQEVPPSYGPPGASQSGDPMYQGSGPSYGSNFPAQQQYPYGSSAPSQPGPAYNQTYGPASGATDGYTQPSGGYSQHAVQAAATAYGQGGQPMPAYTQPSSQPIGYGQYPTSQQNYGDPASGNINYAYHGGSTDNGYGNAIPATGHGAQQSAIGQPGYAQSASNPSGYYEQPMAPQAGHPGSAPAVGYTKSVTPQPGYGGQYV